MLKQYRLKELSLSISSIHNSFVDYRHPADRQCQALRTEQADNRLCNGTDYYDSAFPYRLHISAQIRVDILCGMIVLLLLVLFAGDDAKGAQRWFEIAGIRFQPSEIAKIILILFLLISFPGLRIV